MTKPTINRRQLLGTAALGIAAAPLAGCTGVSRQDSQPHYVMVFDQNKCVGCGECKIACNETNKLPKGRSRLLMQLNGVKPDGSNKKDRHYTRVSCQQCEEAPCIRVCPTGAAHRDKETGIVTVDADLCIGCKYCIVACPYNVRYIREDTGAADHCNFCLDTRLQRGEDPACVSACRFDALVFGDVNDPNAFVTKLLDFKDSVRVRPQLGTKPSLRYIPFKKES